MKKLFLPLLLVAAAPPANVTMQNGYPRAITPISVVDGAGNMLGTADNPLYVQGNTGGGGGTYTGPAANQLPASLGAKTGAQSLSVVPDTDTPFPVTSTTLALDSTVSTMSGKLPATLGSKTSALSLSVAPSTDGLWQTQARPSALAANAVQPVNTGSGSANLLKSSAGNLYSLNVVNGTTAGFVLAYDAAATPAGAATLTQTLIRYAFPVAASAGLDKTFAMPAAFTNGIDLLCSSSLTTYTAITCSVMTGQAQ